MRLFVHALILTAFILTLNLSLRTMLADDDATWEERVELHEKEYPFKLRFLANRMIEFCVDNFGLSAKNAFIVSQYTLLFLLLLLFPRFLSRLDFGLKEQISGTWIMGLSFPILCVHFVPNYSWDDLFAYVLLVMVGMALTRRRIYLAAFVLGLSVMTRESVLLVAPAIAFFKRRQTKWKSAGLSVMIPFLIYAAYRLLEYPHLIPGRFTKFFFNFADWGQARQTFHSLFVSFGWLWAPAITGVISFFRGEIRGMVHKGLAKAVLLVVPICVAIVLVAAQARETRLFFIPFVFLIPLALIELEDLVPVMRSIVAKKRLWVLGVLSLFLILVSIGLSIVLFPSFPFLPMLDFHRVFFALNLAAMVLYLILRNNRLSSRIVGG